MKVETVFWTAYFFSKAVIQVVFEAETELNTVSTMDIASKILNLIMIMNVLKPFLLY